MNQRMGDKVPAGYGRNKRRVTNMKFWIATVAANLVGLAMAAYCAAALRAIPATDAAENGWKFAYYGSMFVVGLVDALCIDQILFKGAFRLAHLKGFTARFSKANADVELVAASMQRSNMSFPVTLLGSVLLTYFMFNLVNHDFDSYYRLTGKYFSALRGDDPERAQERREAIAVLSIRNTPEVIPFLVHTMERDGEVGAWAAWALGRHREDRNPSRLIGPLVAAAREGDPALQREATLSLARLQHRPFAKNVQEALDAELDSGGEVDIRLLWALAYLQDMSSMPTLERALYEGDVDIQRAAAWAISQHRDQRGAQEAVTVLESRLPAAPFQVKCAIVHSLGVLADESSNLALMHAHDGLSADDRRRTCQRMSIFVRPDGKEDRYDLLVPQETFQRKTLQAMGGMRATTPEMREQVEPWLEGLIAAEDTPGLSRESAQSLLAGIRQARDDRTTPAP